MAISSEILLNPAGTTGMSLTPEHEFQALVKRSNLTSDEVTAVFDKLKPIKPEHFIGTWLGGCIDTSHPAAQQLDSVRWAGKTFKSTEDVDPIMVYKDDGSRKCDESWGHARLRQIEFRGVVSTAMVYDIHPIIDYFRYVNNDLIAGAMDAKTIPGGTFYFYLHKGE